MLIVKGRNENIVEEMLKNMNGVKVVKVDNEAKKPAPVIKDCSCGVCPHFEAMEGRRSEYVKWGHCNKLNANVNRDKDQCSVYKNERKEADVEEQKVKRIYAA